MRTVTPRDREVGGGPVAHPLGVLERGRGREHQHLVGARSRRAARRRTRGVPSPHSPPPTRASDPAAAALGSSAAEPTAPRPDRPGVPTPKLPAGNLLRFPASTGGETMAHQADRRRRLRDSWARGSPRWRPRPASRWCCAAAPQAGADAMLAGLEKSLARQVEKGRLDDADRDRGPRPGHAPSPTSPSSPTCDLVLESIVEDLADQAGALRRARPRLRARRDPRHQHVDAARGRDGDGHRAAPSGCAASTSSTPRR